MKWIFKFEASEEVAQIIRNYTRKIINVNTLSFEKCEEEKE